MADHEENDEDLFADLYDGEDSGLTAPPAAEPVPAAISATEPAPAFEPSGFPNNAQNELPTFKTEDDNDNAATYGNGGGFKQEYDDDMQGAQDWNNQGGNGQMKQEQDHSDDYDRPIGIKEDGKMFIGGLNWETTDQSLKDYFSQFGEVVECTVMRDNASGRSRGFGFLTFRDPKTVNIVMVKEHQLDGKIIDPKRAIPRDEQERTSKIFVGGVSQEASESDFKGFFMQFGRVLDATLMMDKDTGRPRGFGFVTFDSEAAVDRTLQGPLEILGKPIEVKKAQPRGNIREEDAGGRGNRFDRNKNDRFGGRDGNQGGSGFSNQQNDMGGAGGGAGGNQMSQAQMAQYWSKMQQYFQMMQQQMMAGGMGGMGGQPNPAMMMAMQRGMNGGQGMGGMNPQMMQQMQQMQNMQGGMNPQMMQNQGMQQSGMMSPSDANRPAYNAQEQMAFEQQKYERQAQRVGGGGGGPGAGFNNNGGGSQTSWEDMYDDVPQPANMAPAGGMMQGGGGGGRGNYRGGGRGGNRMTPQPAANAPANAPKGPKNAGAPGANYRGGGRGGHRGFHPYQRG